MESNVSLFLETSIQIGRFSGNKTAKDNITRIIGVVLLVISILAHKHVGNSIILLVFAGLVMLISNKRIAKKEWIIFFKSFRELKRKKYYLIALYDVLCLGIFFFIAPLFSNWFVAKLSTMTLSNVFSLVVMLFAYLFAVTLLLLAAYSVFKCLVWLTIFDKKADARYFKGFFLLNLCWWLILIIPLVIVLGAKQEYIFYCVVIFAVLYIHFTSVMHFVFMKNLKIGKAIKQAFTTTFSNFSNFLLPYSYAILVYFILLQVFWIVPNLQNLMLFASILFIVFYLAWYRLYLVKVVGSSR